MRMHAIHRTVLGALFALLLVTAASAVAATQRNTAAPTITSFSPASGVPGTTVTIHGTNLSGAKVQFNGTEATEVLNQTPTVIVVKVPPEVTTGPIAVTTSEGIAQSKTSFTILAAPPSSVQKPKHPKPVILSFSPTRASPGTQVMLTGKNFGGATWVKFGGVKATFRVPSTTKIIAKLPVGAHSGKISVKTSAGLGISARLFKATTGA